MQITSLIQILPPPTQHALFLGQTGSGKTFLAEQLARQRRHILALDTNDVLYWQGFERVTSFEEVIYSDATRIIYAPNYRELYDDKTIDEFFRFVFERKHTTVYVDEVFSIAESARGAPLHYKACLTRGRARGISVWSGSQRPMDIPVVSISEARHFYLFHLTMEQDRQKMFSTVRFPFEKLNILPERYFYYIRSGQPIPDKPLTLVAKKETRHASNRNRAEQRQPPTL